MPERGRPSKLTPERQKKLVDAIRAGNYYETACTYAGIDYTTFRLWMQKGEAREAKKFSDFFEAITRAQSESEARAVALWQQAMPTDWRAAQMFLERRHPDRWGKQEKWKAEVTATVNWVELARQAQSAADDATD